MNKFKAVVAAGLVAMAGVANANLLTNGDFDSDTQASGTWAIYNSLTGWAGLPDIELRNNVVGTAHSGPNFVELDTTGNSGMAQSFSVGAAGSYLLSFWYSARPNTVFNTNGLSVLVEDSLGNALVDSIVRPAANPTSSHQWVQFSQSFIVAAPATYTLSIFAIGRSDSFGTSIDTVAVVPEPGTVALMLAGLGVVGFLARRRGVLGGQPQGMPA